MFSELCLFLFIFLILLLVVYKVPGIESSATASLDHIFNLRLVGHTSVDSVFILVFHVEVFDGARNKGYRAAFLLSFDEVLQELGLEVFGHNLTPFISSDGGKFAILLLGKFLDGDFDLFIFNLLHTCLGVKPIENALFSFIN